LDISSLQKLYCLSQIQSTGGLFSNTGEQFWIFPLSKNYIASLKYNPREVSLYTNILTISFCLQINQSSLVPITVSHSGAFGLGCGYYCICKDATTCLQYVLWCFWAGAIILSVAIIVSAKIQGLVCNTYYGAFGLGLL
jgi:hypothetical protein